MADDDQPEEQPEPEPQHEPDGEHGLCFVDTPVTGRFVVRRVRVAPGATLAYVATDWRGALVVVRGGEIDLESRAGVRIRLVDGDVLWLDGLDLDRLRNPSDRPAVLVAVARAEPSPG
jgi:quercetin dioxygenase-like cupin family protein